MSSRTCMLHSCFVFEQVHIRPCLELVNNTFHINLLGLCSMLAQCTGAGFPSDRQIGGPLEGADAQTLLSYFWSDHLATSMRAWKAGRLILEKRPFCRAVEGVRQCRWTTFYKTGHVAKNPAWLNGSTVNFRSWAELTGKLPQDRSLREEITHGRKGLAVNFTRVYHSCFRVTGA
jgi:hypothetical protein